MKAGIAFGVLILIVAQSAMVGAQEVQENLGESSINPDSIFWGLEKELDKISLALTFNDKSRAERGIQIARERLLEFKLMAEKGDLDDAEKAKISHGEFLEEVRAAAKEIEDENKTVEIKEQIEIEKEIEEFETLSEEVGTKIKLKIETSGNLTDEQKALIESLIMGMQNQTGSLKIEIKQNKEKIKIEIKQETGKSEIEIDEEIEELEDVHNLTETKREKALKKIEDAQEGIAKLELEISSSNIADNAVLALLNNSKSKLSGAQSAFNLSNYGEAYGLANAAEHSAEDAREKIEKIIETEDDDERGGENNEHDGQVCIQVITPARNEKTGECRDFPTPCDVPKGWEKADSCQGV